MRCITPTYIPDTNFYFCTASEASFFGQIPPTERKLNRILFKDVAETRSLSPTGVTTASQNDLFGIVVSRQYVWDYRSSMLVLILPFLHLTGLPTKRLSLREALLQGFKFLPHGLVLRYGDKVRTGALHVGVVFLKHLQHL